MVQPPLMERFKEPGKKQTRLLQEQIGNMLAVTPQAEDESPFERLKLLAARAQELRDPAKNKYKNNFHLFLTECVWTKDEAASRVAQMPSYPFLKDLADDLLTERKLLIEKSRRVLASWTVCAFDVWVAAGGRDPRWETLTNGDSHRLIWIAARQAEQANWFLFERVKFLVEQSLEHGLKQKWPDFPDFRWKEGVGMASNGSQIRTVPQGADAFRGPAATLIHMEEIAFMEEAKATIEGAIPTLRGGGHLVAITTPNNASYAQLVASGDVSGRKW